MLAVLCLVFVVSVQHGYTTAPWAWVTAGATLAAAAASGRWPIPAAVVSLIAVATEQPLPPDVTTTASVALLINAASATAREHRHALALAATMIAGAFVGLVLHFDHYAPTLRSFIPFAVATLVAVGSGLLWRLAARRLSHQRDHALVLIEDLRLELARELHDTVAQSLSHAAMRAWLAAEATGVPEPTRDELIHIAEDCASATADLRLLLSFLREDGTWTTPQHGLIADAGTLTATVEEQAERLRERDFTVHVDVRLRSVSALRSATLAKIVREVANNIIKHAPPRSTCWLSVHEDEGTLHGVFINQASSSHVWHKGLGLIGIEERLRLLRGTSQVSLVDGVWRHHVTLSSGGLEATGLSYP